METQTPPAFEPEGPDQAVRSGSIPQNPTEPDVLTLEEKIARLARIHGDVMISRKVDFMSSREMRTILVSAGKIDSRFVERFLGIIPPEKAMELRDAFSSLRKMSRNRVLAVIDRALFGRD